MNSHYEKLESMYLSAPVQDIYHGISIHVSEKTAEISLPVDSAFFHAAGALHGSVYFRLLDDAAYFAVSSMVEDVFVLTNSFHIDIFRPVTKGKLSAVGKVLNATKNVFIAESILMDDKNRKVAAGKGSFMKSNMPFEKIKGYEK